MWPFSTPKLKMVRAPAPAPVASAPAQRVRVVYHDGEKYPGGWGATDLLVPDYWTLRQRSADLYRRNLYARGIIRRLITNELNTGLHLEATPEEKLLGLEEDALADWSEDVENRWGVWGKDPYLCDLRRLESFGSLQATARREALVVGDVLVVLRQDPLTRAPKVQLINGSLVRSPAAAPRGATIKHGVEIDSFGRHVAFWVDQEDGTSKRLPAVGEKSGRRLAWLLYGTDKRMDDVRGEPLLSLILQSIKEIDRYRDSTQRKATINSNLALFISKSADKMGTMPITGGALRRGLDTAVDSTNTERSYRAAEQVPGMIIEELQVGEEPKGFGAQGTDEKFGDFEAAIVQGIAWALELPPEILTLSFTNNYSASQAAINEFKAYLNRARTLFGEGFCEPVYQDWLVAEVLSQRITAQGLLEAWRDPLRFTELGAWVSSDWSGNVKPAVDLSKLVRGYAEMVAEGFCTRDRATRELTGTKFSKNVRKIRRENELIAQANKPIAELEASTKPAPTPPPSAPATDDDEDKPEDERDEGDGKAALRVA